MKCLLGLMKRVEAKQEKDVVPAVEELVSGCESGVECDAWLN